MGVLIRKAKLWDLFKISFMWKELMEEIYPEKKYDEESFCIALVAKLYLKNYVILVKEEDDVVAFIMGFVGCEDYENELIAKCEHIYIKKKHRNKKYEKELIKEFLQECSNLGAEQVIFKTTPRLALFWERQGYTVKEVLLGGEV